MYSSITLCVYNITNVNYLISDAFMQCFTTGTIKRVNLKPTSPGSSATIHTVHETYFREPDSIDWFLSQLLLPDPICIPVIITENLFESTF